MARWRTFGPHSTPVAEQRFVGAVRQIVGGRRWSLCLVTKIEPPDLLERHVDAGEDSLAVDDRMA